MSSITQQQFENIVGGYGFEKFEQGALTEFQSAIMPIMKKSLGQTGGRVTMPAEYFGSYPNVYTSNPNGTHHSMATPTDVLARPELPQTFPHPHPNSQWGGANDSIDGLFESALKEVRQSGGAEKKLRLRKDQKEHAKNIFRVLVDNIFQEVRKVAKKTKLLKATQVKRATRKAA